MEYEVARLDGRFQAFKIEQIAFDESESGI
jgi:hypothetical protein